MENIKEIIECSICSDTFSDPKVLPCVHTFCLKCLETLNDNAKQPESKISCPLCRNECLIPAGGLSCLPNNYFVQKILEIEHITAASTTTPGCESCDREEGSGEENSQVSEASVYCLDCQQHFCTQCRKAHDKMRFNKSHKVIKPGSLNLKSDKLMKMTLSFCDKHEDEPVKHYCLDCQLVICLSCYVEKHSIHKCSSIIKEAEQARLQMREDVLSVQEQSDKLLKVSKEIEVEKKTLIDEISTQKDSVAKRLYEVKELNDKEAEALENQLNAIKQLKMKELETAKELNERHQLMMDSFTRYVKEVINQATDAELLRCASTMKTRAADLKTIHTPSDFSAVKIEFRTTSGNVGDIKSIKSNSFVSDPLLLHTDTLHATEKIPINQCQHMTTLGSELYILSPTVKTNLSFQQMMFYIVIPSDILRFFPLPGNGYYQQPGYTHLLVRIQPAYYETAEASLIKLTFNSIQPYTQGPQLEATFNVPENTVCLFSNRTDEDNIDTHEMDICTTNGINLAIGVKITYKKSIITVTASNVRSSTNTASPTSVEITKEIQGIYSMLTLMVYNSLTYEQQRQLNLYVQTRTHVDVTDMVSCSYYNCIYISDGANSLIHRFEQLGSSSQLMLKEKPGSISVTKNHTLMVAYSTNKIIEISTDGTMIREISLPGVSNPCRIIRLEEEQYLVAGNLSNAGITLTQTAVGSTVLAFLVDATGRRQQLGSVAAPEAVDVALDKHGCILILTKTNTVKVRNTDMSCDLKEISLSEHAMNGPCDRMHFDTVHGRLYLAKSGAPGLIVVKME